MRPQTRPTVAVLLAAGLLLTGCTGDPTPQDTTPATTSPTPSERVSGSPTASPSASPTSTLTAAQQEAFEQATDVVMAYRQTVTDLYSGARTRINDLDNYVTGDRLEQARTSVQQSLAKGVRAEPKGVELALVSAEPVKVKLKADPPTVVVRACIDASAVTDIAADGTRSPGVREELDYTVVKTTYLPEPGWAVMDVTGDKNPKDRTC